MHPLQSLPARKPEAVTSRRWVFAALALAAALLAPAPVAASESEEREAAFDAADFARKLERRGEPNPRISLATRTDLSAFPELASHPDLWHLHNFGQGGGRPDADIDWPEAMRMGRPDPRYEDGIALLGTGVMLDHPELEGRICQLEEPGNGIDDDGNGFTDDAFGWDFADQDAYPGDISGHGTFVAAGEACVVPIKIFGWGGAAAWR
mgnify:FL=1